MRSGLPVHHARAGDERSEGHAAGNSLRAGDDVRLDSGVLARPHLAGTPHAGLHLVHDEHNSVAAANALQFLQKELGRRHVAALALDWLDDDARNFTGIEHTLEELVLE